jgi:hypothetical protein
LSTSSSKKPSSKQLSKVSFCQSWLDEDAIVVVMAWAFLNYIYSCFRSAPLHSNSAVNSVNLTAENPLRAQTKTVPLLPLKRLRLDGVTQPVQPRAEPVSVGFSRLPLVDELVNRVKAAERSLDFAT